MTTYLGMPVVPPKPAVEPLDPLRWGPTFPDAAHGTLGDTQMRQNLRKATRTIRDKRLAVTAELPDWEALRDAGSAIKADAMDRLPELLEQLEAAVVARGGTVHWARDAAEANRIVTDVVRATGAREVVKVKSMATQEMGLNEHLEAEGIAAHETDLAELIVQLAGDRPSHILVPAIHRNRDEIRDIFTTRMDDAPDGLTSEPRDLAMAARAHLRELFLRADVAVSGANFAVAETGTIAVVESEGNGRMCLTLPRTLVTVMGIEKVIPTYQDLEVFMQLLPRSSTGERMNPYTTFWTGVTPDDGPQEFHLVLLDNGRSRALADEIGRSALHCIRCSACLNVCPVYERTGGHAYGSVYPGPIGAILTPQLLGLESGDKATASLPFASSLCGACYDACPVKIDIPAALVHLRDQRRHGRRRGRDVVRRPLPVGAAWRGAGRPRARRSPAAAPPVARVAVDGQPGPARARTAVVPRLVGAARPQAGAMTPRDRAGAMTARDAVLDAVRSALGRGPGTPPPAPADVPRLYRTTTEVAPGSPAAVDLLEDRLVDYRASVVRCAPAEVARVVAQQLADTGSVAVPAGLPEEWLDAVRGAGVAVDVDGPGGSLTPQRLDVTGAVLTACRVAVAGTGTIVLDGGPDQGRRVITLVPDRHVCVVRADQVVASVPEAVTLLAEHPERPQTWISGPSATSDIELVRVEGVHGPRDLRVVLVDG